MRVIPVIDLRHGRVVRGVAGKRKSYRPVSSCLSTTADPCDVARAFVRQLLRHEVYVADLDAIGGQAVSWESLAAIAGCGLRLWVDAGIRTAEDAARVACHPLDATGTRVDQVILGLESVDGPGAVAAVVHRLESEHVVFSLDLRAGKPVTSSSVWKNEQPIEIVRQVAELGIRRIIVLDLAHVGTGQGVITARLCRQISDRHRDMEIITGGGIATAAEVAELSASGVSGVLVASALHDGRIGNREIDAIERL